MVRRENSDAVAHIRQADGSEQSLEEHLYNVAALAERFASKVGDGDLHLAGAGRVLGLLHDFGKYSSMFQRYIRSANNLLDKDSDAYIDAARYKGKIDHSSAGAQFLWTGSEKSLVSQMLALAICSHHSGLIDCLSPAGDEVFLERMAKDPARTFLPECREKADPALNECVGRSLGPDLFATLRQVCGKVIAPEQQAGKKAPEGADRANAVCFQLGLLARFLLSCLLDADRIDSACFEDAEYAELRRNLKGKPDWACLGGRLEERLTSFSADSQVNSLRREIADACRKRSEDRQGIFTLTVPTGGGKTLASLRFALAHAKAHGLDRIIYVIPYTSIIDQNAAVAREILETEEERGAIVLEQHSNIRPDRESRQAKLLADNWECPVVFTTMVQFLESLFGSGTGAARRMHTLARSVLIFDEIQTLPLTCAHIFCQALNFLVRNCGTSAVLCTATQPLLGNMPNPHKGQADLLPDAEIMSDPVKLSADFKRVDYVHHWHTPMDEKAIAGLALEEFRRSGSCLLIANTKRWARRIHEICLKEAGNGVRAYYLSTDLCPAHRRVLLEDIRQRLAAGEPVLCCSTQLIECGVDVDFGSVVRFLAGLDSILQAAGRCNRNGRKARGSVHIVTPPDSEENLTSLPDIHKGRQAFRDLMHSEQALYKKVNGDLSHPEMIRAYFEYYFYKQKNIMGYPVPQGADLLYQLGDNRFVSRRDGKVRLLRQSFASAAAQFRAIDAPTRGLLVPYDRGESLIAELASASSLYRKRELLREAQSYSVNLHPSSFDRLVHKKAVNLLEPVGVCCLLPGYYDVVYGVCEEPVSSSLALFG